RSGFLDRKIRSVAIPTRTRQARHSVADQVRRVQWMCAGKLSSISRTFRRIAATARAGGGLRHEYCTTFVTFIVFGRPTEETFRQLPRPQPEYRRRSK